MTTSQAYHPFGIKALERMAEAPVFNRWMYDTISPYLHGNILEIGSGIGNISSFCIEAKQDITLSDIDAEEVNVLKERFASSPYVKDILQINIADEDFTKSFLSLANTFDSVFLLNVLEHIEEDALAVQHCSFLLKPGGTLVVLVPAYKCLFSEMDKLLAHYRRYTTGSLSNLLVRNHFSVARKFYFNVLGITGWWWNKLFNKKEISSGKMKLFNNLVPVAKLMDIVCLKKIGLSAIVVAKKG